MTGYSVLKEIRGKFHDMSTTIIMSTSLNKKEDVTLMMKQAFRGTLSNLSAFREIGERILRYYEKIDHDRASAAIIACQRYLEEMARAAFKSETPAKEPPLKEPVEKKEERTEEKKEEDQNASDKRRAPDEKKE